MGIDSAGPWHSGEREMQARLRVAERMQDVGSRVIRDYMPDQHRVFYAQVPFLVLAAVDAAGDPWVTLVERDRSASSIASSPDPSHLNINAVPESGDPVRDALEIGDSIGVLGIELPTRRRNRVNGKIVQRSASQLSLEVEHSFGNCPQYIQVRHATTADDSSATDEKPTQDAAAEILSVLDDAARALISAADTFFVASYVDVGGTKQGRQVDASHRGGKAGFVRVDGNVLTIPDFAGNLFFNTLGNLHSNPRAGLVFVDFASGDLLQLTGRTEIVMDGAEIASFQGAERLWRVEVTKLVRRRAVLKLRWNLDNFSPNSLMTGSWQEAQARQKAMALRDAWRRFRVMRVVDESASIKSIYLEPTDGAGLPVFKAGQHLPIRLNITPGAAPVIRTYTLSVAPSDGHYRISVKREGVVSTHIHQQLTVGSELEARAPLGDFVVDAAEHRPLVLLSAGVGITPLLAMLRHVVYEGLRNRRVRPTYFVHSARTKTDRAFDRELHELLSRGGEAIQALRVLSQPETEARQGTDYEVHGRIDIHLLKALLPFDDYDFYLCGPAQFTQDLYDGLRALRIPDDRIHAEQFGPSSLRRRLASGSEASELINPPAAENEVSIVFAKSAKEATWSPGNGTLLELAESRGLTPEFSCRGGSCGTCKTKILSGQVSHISAPGVHLEADEALICCAVPAAAGSDTAPLVLDL
ncbi:MAG: pyridoxamine 5'-phosphate oxidase family protein [Rhodocyclaceae bacterium]|nr:pyridoxamine 5'-phosphate oxidase family protein [Rhodocyclaceae bacterium]